MKTLEQLLSRITPEVETFMVEVKEPCPHFCSHPEENFAVNSFTLAELSRFSSMECRAQWHKSQEEIEALAWEIQAMENIYLQDVDVTSLAYFFLREAYDISVRREYFPELEEKYELFILEALRENLPRLRSNLQKLLPNWLGDDFEEHAFLVMDRVPYETEKYMGTQYLAFRFASALYQPLNNRVAKVPLNVANAFKAYGYCQALPIYPEDSSKVEEVFLGLISSLPADKALEVARAL